MIYVIAFLLPPLGLLLNGCKGILQNQIQLLKPF